MLGLAKREAVLRSAEQQDNPSEGADVHHNPAKEKAAVLTRRDRACAMNAKFGNVEAAAGGDARAFRHGGEDRCLGT